MVRILPLPMRILLLAFSALKSTHSDLRSQDRFDGAVLQVQKPGYLSILFI